MSFSYTHTITVKPVTHGGEACLGLYFTYNTELIEAAKSIGCTWSASMQCWYLPNNPANLRAIFEAYRGKAWVNKEAVFNNSSKNETQKTNNKKQPRSSVPIKVSRQIQELVEQMHRQMRQANYSKSTMDTYVHMVKLFFSWHTNRSPESIGQQDLIDFNNDFILKNDYSLSFQNQMINALKYFFNYCAPTTLDTTAIERPRKKQKLPEVLSKEEVKSMLAQCSNLKHRTALSLIYGCGLRRSELLNLKLSDIDRQRMVIWIRQSKGAKDRFVPLSPKLLELIEAYYKADRPATYLFEGPGGHQYSAASLRAILKRALNKAGIKKEVTLHGLRHSYATHLHEAGTNLEYIRDLLGHKNSKTTEIYTHISNQTLRNIKSPFDDL